MKETEDLREDSNRKQIKKLDSNGSRVARHRLGTIHRQSKLDLVAYFHCYDRGTRTRTNYITRKELTHSYSIILISALISGTGIGQLIRFLGG